MLINAWNWSFIPNTILISIHRKSDAARLRDESGEDIFPEDRVELLKGLSEKADIYER